MTQRHWVRVVGACTGAALLLVGGIAEAGWRHRHGSSGGSSGGSYGSSGGSYGSSGGSHGSSGGSYGSSGGSYGSSGGSYGSSGGSSGGYGWHARWHARHSSHGSSGGSYSYSSHGSSGGSHGSSGGSYGSYGGSHGSYGGSHGSYGGSVSHGYVTERVIESEGSVSGESVQGYRVIDDKPAAGSETIKTPAPAAAPGVDKKSSIVVPADGGMLVLNVPESAKVFINGTETKATGSVRRYLSRGLKAGEKYDFTVRLVVDGTPAEQTRVVTLTAGQQRSVSFDTVATTPSARTSLTLRVPAGAKVWLAGQPTNASGELRRFATASLATGEKWAGYEVRVVTVEAGKERVVRKVIDLIGGDSVELTLNGDELHADEGGAAVEQSAGSSAPATGVASIR